MVNRRGHLHPNTIALLSLFFFLFLFLFLSLSLSLSLSTADACNENGLAKLRSGCGTSKLETWAQHASKLPYSMAGSQSAGGRAPFGARSMLESVLPPTP
ncbi:hypothetical protein GGR50DRAFT_642696 [Xylaria sp. CBS 124048]|nr:hypothetical protein GGR50DRAFT_642696 [Xylaria sp. CBS 124048]